MKKLFLATILFGSLTFLPATSLASESGEFDYDTGKYTLTVPEGKILPRVVEYVGGGTWDHWIGTKTNYTSYNHGGKTHSTTAQSNVTSVSSGWVSSGRAATVSINASAWGNKAFWNTK